MQQSGGGTPCGGSSGGGSSREGSPARDEDLATLLQRKMAPSGRIPRWVLEEALAQERRALLSPRERRREGRRTGRSARRNARRRGAAPRRRSQVRRSTPVVGIVLLVLLWFAPGLVDRHVLPVARPWLPNASAPPPGVGAAAAPLGAPPATAASDGYRFHASPDPEQEMVAFDPCRPVHYVVRPDGAPAGGQQLVEEAVAEISAATGLQFVDDGPTTEGPGEDRDPYQPERYGKRWAPLLITWSDPAEVPGLAGNVAGLAGPVTRQAPDSTFVHVTGQVVLDAPDLRAGLEQRGDTAGVRGVILHELAHVVGLDHVDDPGQLMHPDGNGVTGLADGDRAGLARLGAGPCVPRL